jgi:hypothetical protein
VTIEGIKFVVDCGFVKVRPPTVQFAYILLLPDTNI